MYCVGLCACPKASGGFRMCPVLTSGIFRKESYRLWHTHTKYWETWRCRELLPTLGVVWYRHYRHVCLALNLLFGFDILIQLNIVSVLHFNWKVHALSIPITVIFLIFIFAPKKRARMNVRTSPYIASVLLSLKRIYAYSFGISYSKSAEGKNNFFLGGPHVLFENDRFFFWRAGWSTCCSGGKWPCCSRQKDDA